MQPFLCALGLVEDTRFGQGYDVLREGGLIFGLWVAEMGEYLDMLDKIVLQPLLHLDVETLLGLREHHLDCDQPVDRIEDLGEDLVACLHVLALKLHPQIIKSLEVLLQLALESLQAIGKVILELRFNVSGNLCHVAIHLLQKLLRKCLQLLWIFVFLAIVCHTGLFLDLSCSTNHIMVEPKRKVLRSGGEVLMVIIEPVVFVRLYLEVFSQQTNHVQESRDFSERKIIECINGNERQAFLNGHTLLQKAKLAGAFELHNLWSTGHLCLLLLSFLPHVGRMQPLQYQRRPIQQHWS
mmetsp:Transcript_86168/g.238869  ORF Transcript_86168/g.238869 Transcript_86168/m.238869 type:complete len:296 (+) Transcript_86168:449-1336(+)